MILALLLPYLVKVWVLADFAYRQEVIAEVLCINKDKPQRKCNGKCYLSQKLKATEDTKADAVPGVLLEFVEYLLFNSPKKRSVLFKATLTNHKLKRDRGDLRSFPGYLTSIFRPPILF